MSRLFRFYLLNYYYYFVIKQKYPKEDARSRALLKILLIRIIIFSTILIVVPTYQVNIRVAVVTFLGYSKWLNFLIIILFQIVYNFYYSNKAMKIIEQSERENFVLKELNTKIVFRTIPVLILFTIWLVFKISLSKG